MVFVRVVMSLTTRISHILSGLKALLGTVDLYAVQSVITYKVLPEQHCTVIVPLPLQIISRILARLHPLDLLLVCGAGDAFDIIATARHVYVLFGLKRGNQFLLVCPYVQVGRILPPCDDERRLWPSRNARENPSAIVLANKYEVYMIEQMQLDDDAGVFRRKLQNSCRHFYFFFDWDRCGEQYIRVFAPTVLPLSTTPPCNRSLDTVSRWPRTIGEICKLCATNLNSFGFLTGAQLFNELYDDGSDFVRNDTNPNDNFRDAVALMKHVMPTLPSMCNVHT